jgi:hypothetical protein
MNTPISKSQFRRITAMEEKSIKQMNLSELETEIAICEKKKSASEIDKLHLELLKLAKWKRTQTSP